MSVLPRVMILHATGTNRDREALLACERAGGQAEIVHVNQLRTGARRLADYQMLVLPGGFSYGDDLGAGRIWASVLAHLLQDQVKPFIEAGKPVIGICNGFQALVKSGWLPGPLPGVAPLGSNGAYATLTYNASNRFECRWVWLEADPKSPCVFTQGLRERIYCPVAHGEGRFVPRDTRVLAALEGERRIAVRYVAPPGQVPGPGSPDSAPAKYPDNPNGSVAGIAGICNALGTVFGLMPHPEDHILAEQHPRWTRGETGNLGLALFENGIRYACEM